MVKTREEIYAEAERSRARKADILRRRQEKEIERARKLKRLRDRDAKRTKAMAEKRAAVLQAKRAAEIEKRRAALPGSVEAVERRARKAKMQARLGLSVADKALRHRYKKLARAATKNAINRGELVRGSCAICGATSGIETHHVNYMRPLDVVWLCSRCHGAAHSGNSMCQWGLENIWAETENSCKRGPQNGNATLREPVENLPPDDDDGSVCQVIAPEEIEAVMVRGGLAKGTISDECQDGQALEASVSRLAAAHDGLCSIWRPGQKTGR